MKLRDWVRSWEKIEKKTKLKKIIYVFWSLETVMYITDRQKIYPRPVISAYQFQKLGKCQKPMSTGR